MRACGFVKTVIANRIDSGETLPKWVVKHLDRCGHCRTSYETESRLIEELASSAPECPTDSAPFLKAKIMAAISREERAPGSPGFRPSWLVGALAALAVITIVSFQLGSHLENQRVANNTGEQNLSNSDDPLAPVLAFASRERLLELSRNLDEPLETELQMVMRDAKTAMQTLAQNFLPNQMVAQVQQ